MALEDMASLRAIHGSVVLHPSDAQQTAKLVAAVADYDGISFIRTLRGKTPVRTAPDEDVRIGGSRIAHEGDDVAIVACGITLDEAVKAAERLAADGVDGPRASTPTRSSRSTPRPSRPPPATAARS